MLILTSAVADQVRGLTVKGHALAPKPLADGTWALPEAVLNDPFHASKRDFLIANADIRLDSTISAGTPSIPGTPDSPIVGSDWSQDATLLAASTYNSTWPEGQLITVKTAVV